MAAARGQIIINMRLPPIGCCLPTSITTPSIASSSKIPLIWGTDAVHGHNNVYGATIYPHNIGLGAAHDAALVQRIGAGVAQAVRATGIQVGLRAYFGGGAR